MKKPLHFIFLFPLFTFINCFSFAQTTFSAKENTETAKDNAYKIKPSKWSITLNASNAGMFDKLWLIDLVGNLVPSIDTWNRKTYAVGLIGDYSIKGNKTLRIKVQMANENINLSSDSRNTIGIPGIISIAESTTKQTIMSIEPSIIWKNEMSKLTIYEGFTLPFIIVGKCQANYYGRENDTTSHHTILTEASGSVVIPGGFAVGLGILSGLHLNISKHFNVGMEFSFAYLYSDIEGERQDLNAYTIYNSLPSNLTINNSNKFKQVKYEFSNLNSSFNITYSF